MKNAHKPAFPCTDGETFYTEGLTKREKIAAMAMQGLLASGRYQGASEDALGFADALLNQLEEAVPGSVILQDLEQEIRYIEGQSIKKVQVLNLIETKRKEVEGV